MEFLIVIVAAAAVVWTTWFVLRGSLVAGCIGALITSSCFGYMFWHYDGGLPLSADRMLIGLLAATYLLRRRFGAADPKPLGRAEWVMLAFLGVLAFSTLSHDWHDHNGQPMAHFLFYWLMPAVLYWIARQSPLDERSMRWTAGALAVFGVYLGLIALAETTRQWWAVIPTYIASPTTEFFGRARGPFLHPAEMGIYLTLCLAAALTFWPQFGRVGKLLLVAFSGLALGGVYATLTRCAWMGGALGLAIFIGFNVSKQWRILLLGIGSVAVMAFLATSWDDIWNLKRDVKLDASASADSAELRPILARVALDMFQDRPLFGFGYGQYDREKMPYLANRTGDLPLEKVLPYVQHNAWLALLAETGLAGMGLFILLMALWIRNGWRVWADETAPDAVRQMGLLLLVLVGAYFPNAMFQDTNIIEGVNLLMFCMAGIVSGLAANVVAQPRRGSAATSRCTQSTSTPVVQHV